MKKKRKICILTGSRSEYGLLKPVMYAIQEHKDLTLVLIVTGMHLSEEFGMSINEIIKDGFNVDEKFEMLPESDSNIDMAKSIGKGIIACSTALNKIKPDIFLILGDRVEALAGVIAAAYMNIPIAHIHGGDISRGGLDESARHAITKFAHIHFPATEKSAERIKKMGEDPSKIFVTGAPGLDSILHEKKLSREEIEKKYNLDLSKKLIVLVQHSVSTETEKAREQIIETLKAIKKLKYQTIIIYPNSDAGGREIIKAINEFADEPFIKKFKNLPHKDYLSILQYADLLIGNSSSGIIESSSFKIPVVNIGIRQEGRERSTNVIDVNHNSEQILSAIKKALFDKKFKEQVKNSINPYGDGTAGKKIAEILSKIDLNKDLLKKKITY